MSYFNELRDSQKLQLIKREFITISSYIFQDSNYINKYISEVKVSEDQAMKIVSVLQIFNENLCICCRKFNANKLLSGSVPPELYPLIDIARQICLQKRY